MKTAIVLHHTADSSQSDQYQKVWEYHNIGAPRSDGTLKWPEGHGIQYPKFIERHGTIIEGRKETDHTWHAGHLNATSIAICLAGDFRVEKPTDSQINSLVEVINDLKTKYPIEHIYNHFEVRPTGCPIIDLVRIYEEEMSSRNIVPMNGVQIRIRSLQRGMRRANVQVRNLLQKQLNRLLNRIDERDHDV